MPLPGAIGSPRLSDRPAGEATKTPAPPPECVGDYKSSGGEQYARRLPYKKVEQAAEQVAAEVKTPTIERIRALLGRDSNSTSSPHLKYWKETSADAGAALRLPDPVLPLRSSPHRHPRSLSVSSQLKPNFSLWRPLTRCCKTQYDELTRAWRRSENVW